MRCDVFVKQVIYPLTTQIFKVVPSVLSTEVDGAEVAPASWTSPQEIKNQHTRLEILEINYEFCIITLQKTDLRGEKLGEEYATKKFKFSLEAYLTSRE